MTETEALLAQLKKEEAVLTFESFTNETALQLGAKLVETALESKLPVTIDISRGELQLFRAALPQATKDADSWIIRKNRVVNQFFQSSYLIGTRMKLLNMTMQEFALLDPMHYAANGGAFPIVVDNAGFIGTITVAGLSEQEDHELVISVLKTFLNKEV
ncbi:heme-degrading domain-containing protein [Paenibacillus sp. FJAT-27812]|uniref:heme-degrading domain-containing protein n=1 Tax=Paenibacillus sp. FJAT-27812 TaxID=1684143 RepID=UPI0006A79852|nr:heme-degrading domain-containing protein [Paenibacillus sp. FJAT-27812]